MESISSPAKHARTHYRHELRALTYVVLDTDNGGIIRNLTHGGAAIQAVGGLHPNQVVRLRFELRYPRLRVDARGEVMWADSSGRCGVRFVDLPPRTTRHINEWIFGNLLESIPQPAGRNGSILAPVLQIAEPVAEDDGLMVSSGSRKVISLQRLTAGGLSATNQTASPFNSPLELDWLSRPLSGRSLAWIVDSLIVVAALLLFSLVFLSVANELPKWPKNLEAVFGAAIFVAAFYWGFFHLLAGVSMGTRLARLTAVNHKEEKEERTGVRFR